MTDKVVIIGGSAGGLDAFCEILRGLPPTFEFALILVQHRSPESAALGDVLQRCGGVPISEPVDQDPIESGRVYLALPDYHLRVEAERIVLSSDPPEMYSRPSINVAFESVADAYRERAIGVVLTGANRDGSRGLRQIADRGGYAIVQDPQTAAFTLMPRAAIQQVPEAEVLPLSRIVERLLSLASSPEAEQVEG